MRKESVGKATLYLGDCREVMATLDECSVDSVVCDPPYEIGFMGKSWDARGVAFDPETWRQALRVLKPGGHLLAFGGTRTYHRMVCAIEDAGFEVRDRIRFECSAATKYGPLWDSLTDEHRAALLELLNDAGLGSELAWQYASGFPKSLDVAKAIDKAAGAEREVIVERTLNNNRFAVSGTGAVQENFRKFDGNANITAPATDAARQWQGWGTALKPAHEPIVVARKPLSERNVAANVLRWGTGAINVDGCRVEAAGLDDYNHPGNDLPHTRRGRPDWRMPDQQAKPNSLGRWPANIAHDGSDEVLAAFPQTSGGSAARFFYTSKASKADRGEGNLHPTVKPTDLMRWLVRLVTPPGGTVLDPFAGSGSTLKAAELGGFASIGIEMLPEHLEIIVRRVVAAHEQRVAEVARPQQLGLDV